MEIFLGSLHPRSEAGCHLILQVDGRSDTPGRIITRRPAGPKEALLAPHGQEDRYEWLREPVLAGGDLPGWKASLTIMAPRFVVGEHVRWNSEAGEVEGVIRKVHTRNVDFHGYTRHCSVDDPQYEIESDKTGHIAMHKGSALHRISDA